MKIEAPALQKVRGIDRKELKTKQIGKSKSGDCALRKRYKSFLAGENNVESIDSRRTHITKNNKRTGTVLYKNLEGATTRYNKYVSHHNSQYAGVLKIRFFYFFYNSHLQLCPQSFLGNLIQDTLTKLNGRLLVSM